MIKKIIPFLLLIVGLSLYAQENPKIDRKALSSSSGELRKIKKVIKQGDVYFKAGRFNAALEQYMTLYSVRDDYSPLNYKIAVSHLYGRYPENALSILERTDPNVTIDYYYQKGIALIYHQRYAEAKKAFQQYLDPLPVKRARRFIERMQRLNEICDFSEKAIRDSIPVFIVNAGANVNSIYDDYSAVELLSPKPGLYFTSRRPKENQRNMGSYAFFPERMLFSSEFEDGVANEAKPATITSGKHISVAGIDHNTGALLYFKGKKRFGDVYQTKFRENGKSIENKRLNRKISKKTTAEGSISFAEDGDAYFISDRMGGKGGKDIWYARKKGNNSYYRPENLNTLNTPSDEESVYVTPDGNTLYFSSNGYPGFGGHDIYKSVRMSNGMWGYPVNMGYPINGPDDDLFYRLTSDSTLALFSSKRSDGFGGMDVYYIKKDMRIPFELSGNVKDAKTGKSLAATVTMFDRTTNQPVATALNDTLRQLYVMNLDNTGDYFLQVVAPGYREKKDDFVNPETRFAKVWYDFELERLLFPYNLNGYITDARTGEPVMAEIIARQPGTDNIMYSTVSDQKSGFYSLTMDDRDNVEIVVKADGYFERSESMKLKNATDDSSSKNFALQKSVVTYVVTGVITSASNGMPLQGHISASMSSDPQFTQGASADENGKYKLLLPGVGPFLLEITAEDHFFAYSAVQFKIDSLLVVRNFALKKMESGAKMVIDNILFDTGKATLLPASYNSLNRLVNLLTENPKVKIEVSGHTDNTGSAATNKTLSKNRAASVRNYLIQQGISGDRVLFEGYGFDRPIAPNTTAAGRAANRRVEIEILD